MVLLDADRMVVMAERLSLRKAAARLGIHHATLSRAVKRGEIVPESVTPGGFMRFSGAEVERYRREQFHYKAKESAMLEGRTSSSPGRADTENLFSIDRLLESIPEAARRLVRAEYAALGIMDKTGKIVRFITSGVSEAQHGAIGDFPKGQGLLGAIFREGKSIRIADIARDPRSVGFPLNHPNMKSFLGVPIVLNGQNLGNFYLTNKQGAPEFTEFDQEVVEMLALTAASAIENARLYMRESQLRLEAEHKSAQLAAVIESSAAAVIVADAKEERVILANQEASNIAGVAIVPGDSLEHFMRAATRRRPDGTVLSIGELPLTRALRDGVTTRGAQIVFDLPDGRKIPTVVNAAPVYDGQGAIAAAIAVFEDITSLQEVERVKADFLSMVSHDLRGPLSTIKGLSSSLLMEQGPRDLETILEYVRSIDEEADRMTELVGNLLDMSRIEAGAMPLDPELCHLADIIAECVRRVHVSRLGGKHNIVTDVPLELPQIYADYDQIGRVLTNLLSNAIKYSPHDSEVRVRSYVAPNDSHAIVTQVHDQGYGIPDDEKDKLFQKFYRVTTQRGRARPGSGLGLAICKSIIEAHDGRIWFESELGKGSTFFFSLPVAVPSVGT